MKKGLSISLSMIISITILASIYNTFVLIDSINEQISEKSKIETVLFQEATVPCKDTENYGSGSNRDRVCAHGMVVFCNWENYDLPANLGSCKLSDIQES